MATKLQFTHASLDTFMPEAKNAEDVDRLASDDRLWITLTETAQQSTSHMITRVVGKRYQVVNPDRGDVTFLVNRDVEVKDSGGPLVIPALAKPAKDGGHGPRHNSWVRMGVDREDITHTGCHFVTLRTAVGTRGDEQVRQAEAMGQQMTRFGQGDRIATGSGDLNAVLPNRHDVQTVFDKYGLTTTAHEVGDQDPTHGNSRIDYVWSLDSDHRLSVDRMLVRHNPVWNSDHDPIDVWATIAAAVERHPAPAPYGKTTIRGHELDNLTDYALLAVEKRLSFNPRSLTILQGSYNSGSGAVSASAGTHDGGGAVDLDPAGWQAKVHALRAVGFAAWHRPELWISGRRIWGEHVHAILIGNEKLSPAAKDQVTDYRNHRNGLASNLVDNTWHPDSIPVFHMPKHAA